jgi:hypothetical protein
MRASPVGPSVSQYWIADHRAELGDLALQDLLSRFVLERPVVEPLPVVPEPGFELDVGSGDEAVEG